MIFIIFRSEIISNKHGIYELPRFYHKRSFLPHCFTLSNVNWCSRSPVTWITCNLVAFLVLIYWFLEIWHNEALTYPISLRHTSACAASTFSLNLLCKVGVSHDYVKMFKWLSCSCSKYLWSYWSADLLQRSQNRLMLWVCAIVLQP